MTIVETYLNNEFGTLLLYPHWLKNTDRYLRYFQEDIAWRSRNIRLFGKTHPIPREESWIGEPGVRYRYSGMDYQAEGWPVWLDPLIRQIETDLHWQPNAALLNRYRNGADKMGWHADNEPELGLRPTIAILSLGAARDISFRDLQQKKTQCKIRLEAGSLLVMSGALQSHWQHSIPQRAQSGCRISCTFRRII